MATESNDNRSRRKPMSDENDGANKILKKLEQHGHSSIDSDDSLDNLHQALTKHPKNSAGTADETSGTTPITGTRMPNQMSISPDKQFDVHSAEVQEIMGYIPNWIIRWGITVIITIALVLLVGSWFVKYPDIITAEIEITSATPPAITKARTSGKIMHLLVDNEQKVVKDQYLAVLENTANYHHIIKLKGLLDSLKPSLGNLDPVQLEILCNQQYSLGELQSDYESFLASFRDYRRFMRIKYHENKINAIDENIEQILTYKNLLQNQMSILKKEYDLALQEHNRKKSLLEKGLISAEDFEQSSETILQKEYALEGARIQIMNAEIQVSGLNQSVLDLQMDYKEKNDFYQTDLVRACNDLRSRILSWEQTYIIKAPVEGIVSLSKYWSIGQNVSTGDNVMAIIPEKVNKIVGKIDLPAQGSGKVEVGQIINIKLMNFPHTEYGTVTGVITSKSLVAEDNLYTLTVGFPDGLVTNYGINLQFSQNLFGTADIITNDIRLIERIISGPKSLIKRTTKKE